MIDYGYGVKFGPLLEKALPKLFEWRNDPRNYRYFRQYRPITLEEHVSWYRALHGYDRVRMFLVGNGSGKPIGVAGLTGIDRVNSRAEISGYVGDPVDAEALADIYRTLVRYAFDVENLASVWAETLFFAEDRAEALQKAGFDKTGCMPMAYYREGLYITSDFWVCRKVFDAGRYLAPAESKVNPDLLPKPGGETKNDIKQMRDSIDETLDSYLD
jgi:RimJ/RimL family protein N-acetyltransferase